MSTQDCCRFCKKNLCIEGTLHDTRNIFDTNKEANERSVYERLEELGLTLSIDKSRSIRICNSCFRWLGKIEDDFAVFRRWQEEEQIGKDADATAPKEEEKLFPCESDGEVSFEKWDGEPSETPCPAPLTPTCASAPSPPTHKFSRPTTKMPARRSLTEVIIRYPSHPGGDKITCSPNTGGIVENISKENWATAANLIVRHEKLFGQLKESILQVIEDECQALSNPCKGFTLWRASPDDLKRFSFPNLQSDLSAMSPFLFSILSQVTKQSPHITCVAAAIALRGREARMSAFAYYVNSILQYGGAKKTVFKRLSKLGISTSHTAAVGKLKAMANASGCVQLPKVESDDENSEKENGDACNTEEESVEGVENIALDATGTGSPSHTEGKVDEADELDEADKVDEVDKVDKAVQSEGTCFLSGNGLPVHYLRLLAPPLQLLSAAVWQVVQQGLVDHYGMLEEFVTMVTELVPELMSYSQRAQLTLGLRARLVLEMCRGEDPADMQTIQPHLDRIKAPVSTAKDHHVTINQVEESEVNFVELVHSLLEDPSERKYFFQEIFPVYFGSKYDAALEMLVWEFISRLEELLPVPDFTQLSDFLGDSPSFLDECLQSFFPPEDMKAALEHHRNLGFFKEKDSRLLPMDDCILSSLSLPPGTKPVMNSSCSPAVKDSNPPEHKGCLEGLERTSRRSAETSRQRQKDPRDLSSWQLQVGGRSISQERKAQNTISAAPCDETIDLTTSNEAADADAANDDSSQSLIGGRLLRKRKLSGGVEIPTKKSAEATAFLDSSVDDENSGESPLISIWGDYTDSQETSFPVVSDIKVPWSDEETLNLLDIWGKDSVQRALKGCLKNRHIFTQIAQKMAERGYMRTVEQCQTRIKRLKKCFRQNNKGNSRLEYKFYEQLRRILGSSAPSALPEITYDVEEIIDEDESQDGEEDLQFVGHTSRLEIGTRSVPWTDMETLALINTWADDTIQQDLRGVHRTGQVFSIISNKMAAQGFSRTPEQCQTRLKRVKSSFRQCYQNNLKEQEQVKCKFYNELGRILVKDFTPMMQLDEQPGECDDSSFMSFSQQDLESAVGVQEDRKKVPWSDKETIILLEIWGDQQVQQSIRRYPHNGHIFTEISEKLAANGYSRSPEQCHTRIKRLKANYRQCQESMSSSGNDRVDFKFYDLLEQILDKQPSTSCAVVTESIEISEDSNGDSAPESDGEIDLSPEKAAPSLWTDEETLALIEIWGDEDAQRALRGFIHNGYVYGEISERMQDLGYSKSPEQCRWKVKSLRNNFRQCYDKKKSGRRVDYKFYKQLEQILGHEAVALDEYDEGDEQADQDPGETVEGVNAAWTEHETVALVEVWAADDMQHSLKTSVRNSHIFAEISEKMATMGYLRTAEQCHSRIKRLKKTYRRHCNSRRSGGRPAAFRYFDLLAPVLGDNSVYADVDNSAAADALQPLIDKDADLYSNPLMDLLPLRADEQPSGSHLLADLSRKMPWSDQETRTLLQIWGEDTVQLTLRGCLKNRHVFEYISDKMSDRGFIRTTEQCYSRIKRLKYGFLHEKGDFKFFSEMDEIFTKELKVNTAVPDTSVTEEPDDYSPAPSENKGPSSSQWVADGSKVVWSDGETETLLDIWGSQDIQQNLKGCTKNKHVYIQISEIMASHGYLRTPEQCQTRIKRLRANFRHFLEGKKGEKQECKFFDQLVQIFGSKYVINSLTDDTADSVEQNEAVAAL